MVLTPLVVKHVPSPKIKRYFTEAAAAPVETAAVLCFQSFGEFLRWNSHWHAIVLEGGFDAAGRFLHIPFGDLQQITCSFCFAETTWQIGFRQSARVPPKAHRGVLPPQRADK